MLSFNFSEIGDDLWNELWDLQIVIYIDPSIHPIPEKQYLIRFLLRNSGQNIRSSITGMSLSFLSLLSTGKHSTAKTFCKWLAETGKECGAPSSITLLGWKGTKCELKNTPYFTYYRIIHSITDKRLPPTQTDIEICLNSYLFPTTLFLARVVVEYESNRPDIT